MAFTPASALASAEGLFQPHAQGMPERIDGRVVHVDDGDITLLFGLDYGHGAFSSTNFGVGCRLARGRTRGYGRQHKAQVGGACQRRAG